MKASVLDSIWLRYLSAIISTLIALLLSFLFHSTAQESPFIFFFGAIAFSAWYGGLWPGVLATFLALIVSDYFLMEPLYAFSTRPSEIVLFVVFALVSFLISWTENHRRESEAAHRATRDELHAILNGVVDGVLAQDRNGQPIFANPAAGDILGFGSPGALVDTPIRDTHHRYELLNAKREVIPYENLPRQRVFGEGKPATDIICLRFLDTKEERWLDLRSTPVFDQKGKVRLTVTVMRDVTERRKGMNQLREERERLSTVVNTIGDGIITTDSDGAIRVINPAAEKLLGCLAQTALGQPIDTVLRLIDEDSEQPLPNPVRHSLQEKTEVHWKNHALLLRQTGQRVPVEYRAVPIHLDHDERSGALLVLRNITDRLRAEQERHRTEEHLRKVLDTLPILVWVMTPDGVLIEANRTALGVAELSPQDVLNMPFEETYWWSFSEESKSRLREAIAEARRGEAVRYDANIRVAEDKFIAIDFMITPMYDLEGRMTYLIPAALDVTDRKRSEQEMMRLTMFSEVQRKRMNEIIANVPGIVFESSGTITGGIQQTEFVSDYAEKLMGYPVDYWLNNPDFWDELVYPEDREQVSEYMMSVYRHGYAGTVPYRALTKDGEIVNLEAHVTSSTDEENEQFRLWGVIMDITQRKMIEEELLHFTEDLRRSNEELEQFAYIASHDLQEPLRMVASYLQLLEKRYGEMLDEDGKAFLDFAVDGATRMKGLINDLLLYSRVQRSRQAFETVDMQQVYQQVISVLQVQIDDTNAVITADEMPQIIASEGQMSQLLQNLLSNAIKFRSDQPPVIHIGVKREKQDWHFSVQDNGIGIEEEYLDRIFVIFQRLHSREQYPGTGIGLAICKKIVEKHNGRIWVESKQGAGATFHFSIPIHYNRGRRQFHAGD